MVVIEIEKLNKSYGDVEVLHDLNLKIEAGKLIGFLGPNGAGKTTTIRILMGLLNATSGSGKILGRSFRSEGKTIRREVGYLPGDVHMYPNLTGTRMLEFMARVRKQDCHDEIHRLANLFDLNPTKKIRQFSTGMRQKLGLIQALMHRPKLMLLDEPTSALDPLVRKVVFGELRNAVDEGRSVLFSSHSLNEVEELCDEVIILRDGRIVEQQRIEVMKDRALRRVEIEFAPDQPMPDQFPAQLKTEKIEGRFLRGTWSGDVSALVNWLGGFQTADLIIERPDLNDLFMTYYSDSNESGRRV